jgi:hypothetical protein
MGWFRHKRLVKKLYLLVLAMLLFALASAYFLKPGPKSDAPVLAEFASEKKVRYHVAPGSAKKLTSYKLTGLSYDEAKDVIKQLESGGCKFDERRIPMTSSDGSVSHSDNAFCVSSIGREISATLWSGSEELTLQIWEPISLSDPELLSAQRRDPNSIVQSRPARVP